MPTQMTALTKNDNDFFRGANKTNNTNKTTMEVIIPTFLFLFLFNGGQDGCLENKFFLVYLARRAKTNETHRQTYTS